MFKLYNKNPKENLKKKKKNIKQLNKMSFEKHVFLFISYVTWEYASIESSKYLTYLIFLRMLAFYRLEFKLIIVEWNAHMKKMRNSENLQSIDCKLW